MKCVSIVKKYLLLIGRFRITFTANGKRGLVPPDQVSPLPVVDCSLQLHGNLYFYLYFIFLHLALITELLIIENKIMLRRGA